MRDIEFRGFNDDSGWVYGMYVDGFIVDDVIEATDEYIALGRWCPIDIDSLGQFTGMKDKNENEIYEGDICKDEENMLWEVIFNKGMYKLESIDIPARRYILSDVEIVGNMYENQSLINEN